MDKEKLETEEDDLGEDDDGAITEYDLSATPNDFNVMTIFDFINKGVVKIPDFQRNFVWDLKRSSKLIESLIIGLPIPQIFLYEKAKNEFLVIDGQQRLMSIYYFLKNRFPKINSRVNLRKIFDESGEMPEDVLNNDDYFDNFSLDLKTSSKKIKNKFDGLNYASLGDYKQSFELRPIRNIIIKQNQPKNNNSSMYEIFNRLNSGGINLGHQEIRASLYHSEFLKMLSKINMDSKWRTILGRNEADLRMKDIEIILRSFALLNEWKSYSPSMTGFLNDFALKAVDFSKARVDKDKKVFEKFLEVCSDLNAKDFIGKKGKFSISMFESIFIAINNKYIAKNNYSKVKRKNIDRLRRDDKFIEATQSSVASTKNVKTRIQKALAIL